MEKIEEFAKRLADGKVVVKTKINSNISQMLPSSEALHLYRIAQEAINNTVKYSKATRIHIKFSSHSFTITDNGIGFDLSNYTPGYGIHNMKQRSEEMGAEFILISTEKGTTVRVEKLV